MAPPMTPREKVEPCYECGSTERIGTACAPCNPELTALASGPGDHAELAEIATRCEEHWLSGPQEEGAIGVVVRRAQLEALLAENAALRGANYIQSQDMIISDARATEAERKLAEAEETSTRWAIRFAELRKAAGIGVKPMLSDVPGELRKMRSLIDRAAELMQQCTDPERFEGSSTLNVYANMRAWLSDLSKEAERG